MPRLDLSNDEMHLILTQRNRESLVMGHCEDYPCCGHTPDDPCTREWYDHPDAFDTRRNPHALCNHEEGDCDVDFFEDDEPDPSDCEHGDAYQTHTGWWCCDLCLADLVMVTDVSPRAYPSRVVPGLWLEIPVLGWHFEVRA